MYLHGILFLDTGQLLRKIAKHCFSVLVKGFTVSYRYWRNLKSLDLLKLIHANNVAKLIEGGDSLPSFVGK